MNTTPATKTGFIKFNVSPHFKTLAENKAREHGMTVSELGRMLFGAYITGVSRPYIDISPKFLALAAEARRLHEKNQGELITSEADLTKFLDSI